MARKEACCGLNGLELALIGLFLLMTGVSVGLIVVLVTEWNTQQGNT